MSYDDFDISQHAGQPIEAYEFVGTFKTYRYTSAAADQTIDGKLFLSIPISRSEVTTGVHADDAKDLEFSVPASLDLVTDYVYNTAPPGLQLTVYRVHVGTNFATEWIILWAGEVVGFSIEDELAKVRVPNIFTHVLSGNLPDFYYQRPCNHVLYDARCKVNRATFTTSSTVVSILDITVVVVDDGVADGALVGGELVNVVTGERRMVLNNSANVITVMYPFAKLVAGDSVQMARGCDHDWLGDCLLVYSNTENFGGMPLGPTDNPYEGSI